MANPLLTTKCLDLCIQMMLGPDDCPVVSASGQVRGARCGKQLSGVCVAKHCAGRGRGRGRGCCKMTREEAWQWERRVQGRSIVLRPHTPHVKVCFKIFFASVPIFLCPGCTGGVARWSGGPGARHAGVGGGVRGLGRGRALPHRGAAAGQAQHRAEVPGIQRQQGEVLATTF